MTRESMLLTKYVFSAIYALICTKLLILLCEPAINGVSFWRMLFLATLIAGACALFMIAGIGRFVGTGINAHTYSMDRDSVFDLFFSSLIWFVVFGLLLSLALWKFIIFNLDQIVIDFSSLFWHGHNGFFLDLPVYLVLLVFLVRYRRADLSRRILNDQSDLFDSWW